MIYLDHNATTPLDPAVLEAMLPFLKEHFGNPSSTHPSGRVARAAIDEARHQVATLLGAQPEEILFTSGGTEANNLAIHGVAAARPRGRHLVTSVVEHPAIHAPVRHLMTQGWTADFAPVDATCRIDSAEVLACIGEDTTLVTIMHANNEVGTLQPIAEISAGSGEVLVHTDAAQSVGKVPVDVDNLGVDLLSLAGHKLYAPKGIGALYVRAGTPLAPFVRGAGHERGLRPGTENVASIVGLGEACRLARLGLRDASQRLAALSEGLWTRLSAGVPDLARSGHPERLPNTVHVRFPRARGSAVLAGAPGLAASTGSACHAHGEAPSAVLMAMGLNHEEALGSVRLSLGHSTTEADIEAAAASLIRAWKRTQ